MHYLGPSINFSDSNKKFAGVLKLLHTFNKTGEDPNENENFIRISYDFNSNRSFR